MACFSNHVCRNCVHNTWSANSMTTLWTAVMTVTKCAVSMWVMNNKYIQGNGNEKEGNAIAVYAEYKLRRNLQPDPLVNKRKACCPRKMNVRCSRKVISAHTLLGLWLYYLSMLGLKLIYVSKRGPDVRHPMSVHPPADTALVTICLCKISLKR